VLVQTEGSNYLARYRLVPFALGTGEKTRGTFRSPAVKKVAPVAEAREFEGLRQQELFQVPISRRVSVVRQPSKKNSPREGYLGPDYPLYPFQAAPSLTIEIRPH
jgi:hypothetical protein